MVDKLNIWTKAPDLAPWQEVVAILRTPAHGEVRIAIVGKYVNLADSYKSLNEALVHGGIAGNCRVKLTFVDAEKLEQEDADEHLAGVDAILVPGGFGERGSEGKIRAIEYARTRRIPFFGICLGMQMAVVEYARNVCGMTDSCSSEFKPDCSHPVIHLMAEQKTVSRKGGTMRLGAYPCTLVKGSVAQKAYGAMEITERHRHRYEFNNSYRDRLTDKGLVLSGINREGDLVEIVEVPDHPWFLGCQFHPEFKSKPLNPHPLFRAFVAAALENKKIKSEE